METLTADLIDMEADKQEDLRNSLIQEDSDYYDHDWEPLDFDDGAR